MVDNNENKNTYSPKESDFDNVSIPLMLGDVIKISSPLTILASSASRF